MNIKKLTVLFIMLLLSLFMASACGKKQQPRLYNELSFSLDGIEQITISYDEENVSFFRSENDNLVIKEYMSEDKSRYHANVTQDSDSIKISEGGKPFIRGGFVRYIEVYLPESYNESLKVTTTDGDIDISDIALDMKSVRIDCTSGVVTINDATASDIYLSSTSGKMKLGKIKADKIRIDTTRGSVICKSVEGAVSYTSTHGDAQFLSAAGSGTYTANNSGKLSVTYEEVTGNLSLYNKNDDVQLTLPSELNFKFEATTKNGSVNTNFNGSIKSDGDTTSGTVGKNPTVTIKVETKNGDIEVAR